MLESVRIDPHPFEWRRLVSAPRTDGPILGRTIAQWQALTRRELLGAEPKRIIATGHQPGFFHAGILAKYLALDAAGAALDAEALIEIAVDQDTGELHVLRVPVIDCEGVLVRRDLHWSQWPGEAHEGPTGAQAPLIVDPHAWRLQDGERFALPGLEARCRVMGQALMLMRRAKSRAEQAALAAALLRDVRFANRSLPSAAEQTNAPARPRHLVCASSLAETSLWRTLLRHIQDGPLHAWQTYNDAAGRRPQAGVALLERRTSGGCEIPCWLITADGRRHRAFEHDLGRSDAVLWPRALLMTGIARLALCDLFIHGTGGSEYDRITEAWLADWLGADLAPQTTVTATATLDFHRDAASDADLAHARWMLHHLPFNVDRFLDDPRPRHQREAMRREIECLPRRSAARREVFERMRAMQRRLVEEHRSVLDDARLRARLIERRMEERPLLNDRTWAFPLHDHAVLTALSERLAGEFERA